MLFWIVVGCALNRPEIGLVIANDDLPKLATVDGKVYNLHLGPDGEYIKKLGGCQVRIEGLVLHREFWVKNWKVTDGGDGSAPFIGFIEKKGMHYYLKDFNSGSLIMLENIEELSEHESRAVLVVGIVSGAHKVKVMSWRLLD
jgi:hypothetical protein